MVDGQVSLTVTSPTHPDWVKQQVGSDVERGEGRPSSITLSVEQRSEVLETGGRPAQALGLGCPVCRDRGRGGTGQRVWAHSDIWFSFYLPRT